jgi:hypothetical protein
VAAAPRPTSYVRTIAWLGGSAVVSVLIGLLFTPFSRAFLSEEQQAEVIISAIPFVGYFAAIILVFILVVALLGQRFHQAVPFRTHQPIEFTAIAGILVGIVALFQPWSQSPYQFGFSTLLYATLGFILWSHVAPRGARDDLDLPPFSSRAITIGVMGALLVTLLIFVPLSLSARPEEPYGLRQRRWDSMREEQQIEVVAEARRTHRFVTLPVLLLFSALPGIATFYLLREVASPRGGAGARPSEERSATT